ncbi:MAG TPA: UPF0182 family protein [Candidatus Acidoferrales bacterium]|nr:UPF0182 family protein [Candidatus Acidoferrales bacterium]
MAERGNFDEGPWLLEEHGGGVPRRPRILRLILLTVFLLIAFLVVVSGWIQKDLWMNQLGYSAVFWTILDLRCELYTGAFLLVFLYVWFNLRLALKNGATHGVVTWRPDSPLTITLGGQLTPTLMKLFSAAVAFLVALFFAAMFYTQWDALLRFRFGGSFGFADPLFRVDLGFYIFRLPFYEIVQESLTLLALLTLLGVLIIYGFFGLLRTATRRRLSGPSPKAVPHLSVLSFVLVASWGWGFYLDRFDLVYSTLGVVYGAGYTADHVSRAAYGIMALASAALGALLLWNAFRPSFRSIVYGFGAYVLLYVFGVSLAPALFQKLVVQPSELSLETPYLKSNIEFTRKAFALDAIQETSYPALSDLTAQMIARNQDTIQNLRLWDARPLLLMYKQAQEIRLYYQFYQADVDRYHLSDGYHQIMLSARELSADLPVEAQTWVNQRLQFTHGYGMVMSFVSKTVGGGFPDYLISDIPPVSQYGLNITQPAIYYGESMPGYRIVDTRAKEFDYPKGNQNVYTSYAGTGGIPIDSLWRRLLFAWTQGDVNILLTSYLQPGSRIQLWRRVQDRISQIAPFLQLDHDPYPAVSEGKLYWIQDAYTTSDHFPYASPYQAGYQAGLNYIRNSVKVVVDMYNGTVRFYIMDPKDPILAAYRRAFPGVFLDLSQLSPDLKSHLRYPEDLFSIQADLYRTFHMTVPQVFYNREDLWVLPREEYAGTVGPMPPYYILMKLPGSDRLEYLLMTPFTPEKRDNMISWMAAKCDFPDYGQMLFYELPKDKLIYGPMQIEAMIDQNPVISQQLTLWNQKGSRVLRGNLIAAPIENAFLYVVPVYLTAEGTDFPQLKRVIVIAGDQLAMEPTLDEALQSVFNGQATQPEAAVTLPTRESPEWAEAKAKFEEAQKAMQQGDWEKFGKAMDALKRILAKPKK